MSRVGKVPIPIPAGVTVQCEGGQVSVRGPKGQLDRSVPAALGVQVDEGAIRVTRPSDERQDRALHGLARSLIANMITGVTEGFTQILELRGVGYRAEVQGRKLVLQAGFSHPVELEPPDGIEVETQQLSPTSDTGYLAAVITCRGIDKQLLGDFIASVRSVRPVEPYKGKGIRFRGERVRRKLGKAAKTGGS